MPEPTVTKKVLTVGLIGNPNCGKTTLFNALARANAPVGNYPRVTVAIQDRYFDFAGQTIRLVDLPGVYALTSKSPEERCSREFLYSEEADVLVNVLDAGNLERSLFLTTQLLELGQPLVFAINMMDEATNHGISFDLDSISSMLHGKVVGIASKTGQGMGELMQAVIETSRIPHERIRPVFLSYDPHLEHAIIKVGRLIHDLHPREMDQHQVRWLAIKLLEGDDELLAREGEHHHLLEMVRRTRYDLERDHGESCEMMLAGARYGFIHGMSAEAIHRRPYEARLWWTDRLDAILLHPTLGMPVFLCLMYLLFETTFSLGDYPAEWLNQGVRAIISTGHHLLPPSLLSNLVLEGIVTGAGAVIMFLPYILILFFFIAMSIETGYMARSSFLLDRIMHFFGLHGKAFIPLVIGFGCNVPAIMASRTIENPRDRLVAILVVPFISCAQRLPIFILLIGTFFTAHAGKVILLLYSISIGSAMVAAIVLSRFVIRSTPVSTVMELPPLRIPTWRSIVLHMWEKAWDFVRMVGSIIILGSVIIWYLQSFPIHQETQTRYDARKAEIIRLFPESQERTTALQQLKFDSRHQQFEQSYLGRIGKAISPVFAPLGFDWKDSVAILSGFFAKEIIVASYALLYVPGHDPDGQPITLQQSIARELSPMRAFVLMVFFLLYAPCLSTLASIKREAGWNWAVFSFCFQFSITWLLSYLLVKISHILT
ncbi:MAG: ferrous iron transport protein B [Magnetococcales bacterium]|nr:ferrous iron transport protein B [Magnetococcales bacterium]